MKKHLLFWFTVLCLSVLCACTSGAAVPESPAAETDLVPTGFRYEYISYWTAGQESGDLTGEESSAAARMLAELDVDSAQVDTRRLGSSNCTVFALTLDDQDAVTQEGKDTFAAFITDELYPLLGIGQGTLEYDYSVTWDGDGEFLDAIHSPDVIAELIEDVFDCVDSATVEFYGDECEQVKAVLYFSDWDMETEEEIKTFLLRSCTRYEFRPKNVSFEICSSGTAQMPFVWLTTDQISGVEVDWGDTIWFDDGVYELSEEEIAQLVESLRELVFYNEYDYTQYVPNGTTQMFTIRFEDADPMVIGTVHSTFILNGVGYKAQYPLCDRINRMYHDCVNIIYERNGREPIFGGLE